MCSAASKMPPFELAWVPNKHQGVNARSSFRGALIKCGKWAACQSKRFIFIYLFVVFCMILRT